MWYWLRNFRWWAPRRSAPPAYRTGTDAAALNRQPPGELTAQQAGTIQRVGLPGRRTMEARRG